MLIRLCLFVDNLLSYTLSREYWVVRNRYSRLIFTGEDRLCANLRVQKQLATIAKLTNDDCF